MVCQPQFTARLRTDLGLTTVLTPVGAPPGKFRALLGSSVWTQNNAGSLTTSVGPAGVSVLNSGSGYLSRPGPSGGAFTVCFTFTPLSVAGTQAVWSVADVFNSAGPAMLLRQSGSNLDLMTTGGSLNIPGVLTAGVPAKVVISCLSTSTYTITQVILAVNGVVASTNPSLMGGAPLSNEYLGSGYNNQAQGFYGEYFSTDRFISQGQARSFSLNPWQIFVARSKQLPLMNSLVAGTTPISKDIDARWALSQVVGAASVANWNIASGITRSVGLMWNINQTVNSNVSTQFNVAQIVTEDVTAQFNVQQVAAKDVTAQFDTLAKVSKDSVTQFNLANTISRDVVALFGLTQKASKDVSILVDLLSTLNKDVALQYDILSALANVYLDTNLAWSLIAKVTADKSALFNITSTVYAGSVLNYNLLSKVNADRLFTHNVAVQVQKDVQSLWALLQSSSLDIDVIWNTLSSLTSVTKDVSLSWTLLSTVIASVSANWGVLSKVVSDDTVRWNLAATVAKSITANWNVASTVITSSAITWSVVGRIGKDVVIQYQIGDGDVIQSERVLILTASGRVLVIPGANRTLTPI